MQFCLGCSFPVHSKAVTAKTVAKFRRICTVLYVKFIVLHIYIYIYIYLKDILSVYICLSVVLFRRNYYILHPAL